MAMTIRPSVDARVIAQQYLEARRQYDAAPATDKILQATLSGRRMGWAIQLAEEIAPMLAADESPFRAVFRASNRPAPIEPERGDDRELADRTAAQDAVHREPGVGTVQPRTRDTLPAPADDEREELGQCEICAKVIRAGDEHTFEVENGCFCISCTKALDAEDDRQRAAGGVR